MNPVTTTTIDPEQPADRDALRQNLIDSGLTEDTVQAVELRSAIWALANSFADGKCEMTHSEVTPADGKVEQVNLCLTLFEERLSDFAEFLAEKVNHKLPRTDQVSVVIGFNYDNPGLIEIRDGKVNYHPNRDILDFRDTDKLTYGRGSSREVMERFEDVIWMETKE